MAIDGGRGSKGQPHFATLGAPDTAVDFDAVADWAAQAVDRVVATVADLSTVTSESPLYNGKTARVTATPGAIWVYDAPGTVWRMYGVALFADAAARATAIPAPAAGMRSRRADAGYDEEYVGSSWRSVAQCVVLGSGALAAVSAFNIDGLTGFDEYELVIDLPTASAANSIAGRLRAGGAANSSNNHDIQRSTGAATTATASGNLAQNIWDQIEGGARTDKWFKFVISGLNLATRRTMIDFVANASNASADPISTRGFLRHRLAAAAAFDGMGFIVSTGTVTGTWVARGIRY